MSEKYTYADVIIDPNDPRVEIGAEYCFGDIPQNLVEAANSDNDFWIRLEKVSVSDGFNFKSEGRGWKSCIIRKKEPKKKYVPFDLSNEKDRVMLRAAWIRPKDVRSWHETQIVQIDKCAVGITNPDREVPPDDLLEFWEFIDGSPCGKEVEE